MTGRVQGVGFRLFAADCAAAKAWLATSAICPTARVEAVADGDLESLTRFEAALWRGPSRARVDDVDSDDIEPLGLTGGFAIR